MRTQKNLQKNQNQSNLNPGCQCHKCLHFMTMRILFMTFNFCTFEAHLKKRNPPVTIKSNSQHCPVFFDRVKLKVNHNA